MPLIFIQGNSPAELPSFTNVLYPYFKLFACSFTNSSFQIYSIVLSQLTKKHYSSRTSQCSSNTLLCYRNPDKESTSHYLNKVVLLLVPSPV